MIKLTDLTSYFRDTLHDDATLNAWSTTNLSANPNILVGIDVKNSPGEKDVPIIAIHPISQKVGEEVNVFSYTILVQTAILKDERTVNGRKKEYTGITLIDEFSDQVWIALKKPANNIALSRQNFAIEKLENYPLFTADMIIEVDVPNLIGGSVTI